MGLKVSVEFARMITTYGEGKIIEVMNGWVKRCEWQRNRYHTKLKKIRQMKRKKGGSKK